MLALILAAVLVPVTVYVGPEPNAEGFVETDQETLEATKELLGRVRAEMGRNQRFRIVTDASAATVKLFVIERGERAYDTGSSTVTVQKVGTTYVGNVSGGVGAVFVFSAVLQVGDYRRPFEASSGWLRSSCAKRIAKDVAAWLMANHERIAVK